jgi:hypothetical protein
MAAVAHHPELLLVPHAREMSSRGTSCSTMAAIARLPELLLNSSNSARLLSIGFLAGHLPVTKSREVLIPGPRDPTVMPLVRSS